jgi:hypothetical protein
MFFRGIPESRWPRVAYVLVILSFVAVPLHFLVGGGHPLQDVVVWLSTAALVLAFLVAILHKPRDMRLAFYGLLAFLAHAVTTPS